MIDLIKLLRETRAATAIAAMQGLGDRLKTTFTNVSSNMKAG